MNLFQKILSGHIVSGSPETGREMAMAIDQTLTQDSTGTLTYLQFEALEIPRVKTRLSVSYIDHNTLQAGFENADDHRYLQSVAAKYGLQFSRPGNGICHQVHLERFAVPGQTLLGADSHTPTCGGLGMVAIGAGGLDVAVAMAGEPFYCSSPKVVLIHLLGRRKPWISAKDVILEILRRLTVKGGVGKVLEYGGEGIIDFTVPERATITNMGAETGATTSLFPSDETTRRFLKAHGREKDWSPWQADPGAHYDESLEIRLDELEPLIALPHSPDRVVPVREVEGTAVDQVIIGSCTNSSFQDLMRAAAIVRGAKVHPRVSLCFAPGSRQVLMMLAQNGALADILASGARLLEPACGPCIGMGQAPPSGGISLRTINRNFPGRSGTADASVYLAGPEVAALSALRRVITDPRVLGPPPEIAEPVTFWDGRMILDPAADPESIQILRGPNIKPLPRQNPLADSWTKEILIKVGDHITTDHIMPSGANYLPLRSNIPALAEHVFKGLDPAFARRSREKGGGIILAGENYGQGSSREHAALCPMFLGVKAVIAKSFARIHFANLINFGIVPLRFSNPADYDWIRQGDKLAFFDLPSSIGEENELRVENTSRGESFLTRLELSPRERQILLAGGLLNSVRSRG